MNTAVAKKGVGLLFSATKSGLSSLSSGINKTRKAYSTKHESDVVAELKERGASPADLIFQGDHEAIGRMTPNEVSVNNDVIHILRTVFNIEALQRVYFLYMAGYKNELVAAADMAGKRLADPMKSSVPLDAVMILGNSLCNECSQYGDFEKGKLYQSMQDFVTKSRMGKDHCDRELIVHDIYYAVLIAVEKYGTEGQTLERTFKDAASRIIGSAMHVTDPKLDPRAKAAKAIYLFAAEIRSCGREAELRRQKALEDAEELLRKEQEKQRKYGRSSSAV